MVDFEEAWNTFGKNWNLLREHHNVACLGEAASRFETEQWALEQLNLLAGTGAVACSVPEALQIEVTPKNAAQIAAAHAQHRGQSLRPMRDALTLVFAHTIFETLVVDLGSLIIQTLEISELIADYPNRKISLAEAVSDPIGSVRKSAENVMRMDMTLLKRTQLIQKKCGARCATACKEVSQLYGIDFKRITKIDRRRQRIIHHAELDFSYHAAADIEFIELAARYLSHLAANCWLSLGYSYVGINGIGTAGELRLDLGVSPNQSLVNELDILAIIPRGT